MGITVNKTTDILLKEARNLNCKNNINVTLLNTIAVFYIKLRYYSISVNHQLYNMYKDRLTTKTIVRLRTSYHREMKINTDGDKEHRNSDNYWNVVIDTPYF